jgi:hypothetical protein
VQRQELEISSGQNIVSLDPSIDFILSCHFLYLMLSGLAYYLEVSLLSYLPQSDSASQILFLHVGPDGDTQNSCQTPSGAGLPQEQQHWRGSSVTADDEDDFIQVDGQDHLRREFATMTSWKPPKQDYDNRKGPGVQQNFRDLSDLAQQEARDISTQSIKNDDFARFTPTV